MFRFTRRIIPRARVSFLGTLAQNEDLSPKSFYKKVAKEAIARLNPNDFATFTRTLSLCINDPKSIKLHLARARVYTRKKKESIGWFSDILWNIASRMSTKEMVIPPRDQAGEKESIQKMLEQARELRTPLRLSDRSDRDDNDLAKPTSVKHVVAGLCDMPTDIIARVIDLLDQYGREVISRDYFINEFTTTTKLYTTGTRPLFQFLSLPIPTKVKNYLNSRERRRKVLEEEMAENLEKFTSVIPLMDVALKERAAQRRAAQRTEGLEWLATRAYGPEHCLHVSVNLRRIAPLPDLRDQSNADPIPLNNKNISEWPGSEDCLKGMLSPYKVFLGQLSPSTNVESIITALRSCGEVIPPSAPVTETPAVDKKKKKKMKLARPEMKSPVVAMHLIMEDINEVTSKILFDIPENDGQEYIAKNSEIRIGISKLSMSSDIVKDMAENHLIQGDPKNPDNFDTSFEFVKSSKRMSKVVTRTDRTVRSVLVKVCLGVYCDCICNYMS